MKIYQNICDAAKAVLRVKLTPTFRKIKGLK